MLLNWSQSQGLNSLINSASFVAGFADAGSGAVDLTLQRGTGSATFTRATTAWTRNSSGSWISVSSGVARSFYSRTGVYLGYLAEGQRTQFLGVTNAPATQTTASLGTGTYTLWVEGSGSATPSGGTATITGAAAATDGSPNTFTVTVSGTVIVTVSGSLSIFQLEDGAFPTSYIQNLGAAGTSVTRNADVLTYPFSGNADANTGSCYSELSTLFTTTSATATAVSFSNTGTDEVLFVPSGGGLATQMRARRGANIADKTGLSSLATAVRKRAASWGGTTLSVTGDGQTPATATFTAPYASTAIAVGCNTAGSVPWNGTIRNLRIYQTQFTADQLQSITS